MNNTEQIIYQLKKSNLYAECHCGGEFKISNALLFDGTKTFPKDAIEAQNSLKEGLRKREDELKKSLKQATKKTVITTKSVNVGKNLEKILPTMADFKWQLTDSRFLGDPIDLIVFDGLSKGNITSINFVEVKSGKAKLNQHQKCIKDAIEDKKIKCKVF